MSLEIEPKTLKLWKNLFLLSIVLLFITGLNFRIKPIILFVGRPQKTMLIYYFMLLFNDFFLNVYTFFIPYLMQLVFKKTDAPSKNL